MPQPPNPYDFLPAVPEFTVRSADLAEGAALGTPQLSGIFGAGGDDVSPELSWEGFPAGTKSFAVTCYDPDAPTASGFWHWAVFNIPATVTSLPTDAGKNPEPAPGAVTLKNDGGLNRFLGAAPPPGHGPHRYIFTVHAVGVESLDIPDSSTPAFLGFNLFSNTVGRGHLTGIHENKG
ncbi:YbhB/YbcL family Raf kinase inhibitor-like protein [Amycolatopsis lurida]